MPYLVDAFDQALLRYVMETLRTAGLDWLLTEDDLVRLIGQVDGDLHQLALELNDWGDAALLAAPGTAYQDASLRQGRALKTAAALVDR